jgi:aspartate/methionine/tyrosine aminotransferase
MKKFARLDRLPPYVFANVNDIKMEARHAGKDIIDLGMGNPDLATPDHIVDKLIEASKKPHNPTTEVVNIEFFEKIVDYAKEHNILVIHDLAYADLVFDEYKAPSFLQVKGAKDVGVEF